MVLKNQTSNLAVYGETGRFPLQLRKIELQIRYWFRLATMKSENPLYHVYNELLKLHRFGNKTWCDNIVRSLDSIGFTNVWSLYKDGATFEQISPMLPNMKRCLENLYKQTWSHEINDSSNNPVLRTYRLFKSDHNFESYLLCRNYRIRKYLTKFRRGVLEVGL